MMKRRKSIKPALLFFQEVYIGDIEKYETKSNIAKTGGGARDLRIRSGSRFTSVFSRLFPQKGTRFGVLRGQIYSELGNGTVVSKAIEYSPPTDARPGETRVCKINLIDGWEIDKTQYQADQIKHKRIFYLLVLDTDGRVWARTLREEDLPLQDPLVRSYVEERIRSKNRGKVNGSIDFITKKTIH